MRNPLKGSHHLHHKNKMLRERKHLSKNKMRSLKLPSKIKGKLNLMVMSISLRPKIKLKKVVKITQAVEGELVGEVDDLHTFSVTLDDDSAVHSRTLVLATGLRDVLPVASRPSVGQPSVPRPELAMTPHQPPQLVRRLAEDPP